MAQPPPTFRDFGSFAEDLQPPPEKIRSFLSTGRIVGQFIGTGLLSALGVGLMVVFALTMPMPLSLLGCAAALIGFGTFVYLVTHNDYRWVELEGNTIRARHLYTGRTIERSVDDIESLGTMFYQVKSVGAVVGEKLLDRLKGAEIRFRDRCTPLRILGADPAMTHAKEFIEALLYRMTQIRELDAEIVNVEGQPLVRNIHWKGEQPRIPSGKSLKLIFPWLMFLALLFGAILGLWGVQEQERQAVSSMPPHKIAIGSLIQNGPGTNRHVTITDFRPGGYAVQSKHGSWTRVWIALFPKGIQPTEIKVVLSSKGLRDEADLHRLLRRGCVTGICSEAPRSNWGTVLGPELIRANQGCHLSSAWFIEELRAPPGETVVAGIFLGSTSCFVAVILLAMIVYWKAK